MDFTAGQGPKVNGPSVRPAMEIEGVSELLCNRRHWNWRIKKYMSKKGKEEAGKTNPEGR